MSGTFDIFHINVLCKASYRVGISIRAKWGRGSYLIKVTAPVVGNTLLVGALELFAAAHIRVAVGFVREVAAVVAPVTLPEVGDAQPVPALELCPVVAQTTWNKHEKLKMSMRNMGLKPHPVLAGAVTCTVGSIHNAERRGASLTFSTFSFLPTTLNGQNLINA